MEAMGNLGDSVKRAAYVICEQLLCLIQRLKYVSIIWSYKVTQKGEVNPFSDAFYFNRWFP